MAGNLLPADFCVKKGYRSDPGVGAPMKSATLLSKMYELGITPSRGRPQVSNDNPYAEALFNTLKYCPQWPREGFASLQAEQCWVRDFVQWYNHEHRRL